MDEHNLVRMANRIGALFAAFPDRDEALAGGADHVHKFWEPRMRRQILACLGLPPGQGLSPLVRDALTRHRAELTPA